jgi:hypothetical protein
LVFLAKEMFQKGMRINASFWPIIIIISLLNSLINDQIVKLASKGLEGLRPSVLQVKRDITSGEELLCDVQLNERNLVKNGHYNLVFAPSRFYHAHLVVNC